jgi:hypothetical protein
MLEELARGMNIYYRGYVIHEDIRSICYTIYGSRPHRTELATAGTSREAMQWIDRIIAQRAMDNPWSWPELVSDGYVSAPAVPW